MDTITVGTDIKLVGKVDSSTPVGSTATILYVDDFKNYEQLDIMKSK